MAVIRRKQLKQGMLVDVENGDAVIRGHIKRVIPPQQTNQAIEVELTSGTTGVVKHIVTKEEIQQESFKFYNVFFHSKHLLTLWNKYTKETFTYKSKNKNTNIVDKTAFVFSDEVIAKKVLRELNDENLAIRRISRQKMITENFTGENITYYRLNEQRRVDHKRLNVLEKQFSRF